MKHFRTSFPGTAHCADMYPAAQGENAGLEETRKIVYDNVMKWLGISSKVSVPAVASMKREPTRLKPFVSTIQTITSADIKKSKASF